MGNSKPEPQIRKPPSNDQADDDKVAAFIDGEASSNSEGQTSGSSDGKPEREQTTVYLEADVKRKLKAYCSVEGVEMSQFVNDLVAADLEDWSPEF